jgi:hypothetical protein
MKQERDFGTRRAMEASRIARLEGIGATPG